MGKIKKVVSINLLALFGWFNIIIQSLFVRSVAKDYPFRGDVGDAVAWFYMFICMIAIIFIGISGICLLIEYLCRSPNAKYAFLFPYEKIKYQSLYSIFFYVGLLGVILPFIIPFFLFNWL